MNMERIYMEKRDRQGSKYNGYFIIIGVCYPNYIDLYKYLGLHDISELEEFFDNISIKYLFQKTQMFGTFLYFPPSEDPDRILEIINSLIVAKKLIQ